MTELTPVTSTREDLFGINNMKAESEPSLSSKAKTERASADEFFQDYMSNLLGWINRVSDDGKIRVYSPSETTSVQRRWWYSKKEPKQLYQFNVAEIAMDYANILRFGPQLTIRFGENITREQIGDIMARKDRRLGELVRKGSLNIPNPVFDYARELRDANKSLSESGIQVATARPETELASLDPKRIQVLLEQRLNDLRDYLTFEKYEAIGETTDTLLYFEPKVLLPHLVDGGEVVVQYIDKVQPNWEVAVLSGNHQKIDYLVTRGDKVYKIPQEEFAESLMLDLIKIANSEVGDNPSLGKMVEDYNNLIKHIRVEKSSEDLRNELYNRLVKRAGHLTAPHIQRDLRRATFDRGAASGKGARRRNRDHWYDT